MDRRGSAHNSEIGALRQVVRESLKAAYAELGLEARIVAALADGGRVNRGLIICSIGSDGERGMALPIATSVEMMHRASVIIDDIEDDDRVRRGRPCLHVLCGVREALAISDLLLSDAFDRLNKVGSPYLREALATYRNMALGQALDLGVLSQPDMDIDHPAKLKTGALIELCFRLGARISGLLKQTIDMYGEVGMHLGCAFQLQNDMDNFLGNDRRRGRLGSDLGRGNVSSIVLGARMRAGGDYSLEAGLARVAVRRDIHLRRAQAILHDNAVTISGPLNLVIGDISVATDFVGDQRVSLTDRSEFSNIVEEGEPSDGNDITDDLLG